MRAPLTSRADDEDRALIARVATGDVAAFELLVRRHEASLLRFATRTCASSVDAQDTVQEGLLAVWRAAASYRGEGPVRAWMFRVVVHACRHRQRRRVGEPSTHDSLDASRGVASTGGSPEDSASAHQMGRALTAALLALPEEARAALVLRDVEEFSGEEVAEILGITVPAMKSRLHRARAELKGLVDEQLRQHLRTTPEGGELREGIDHVLAVLAREGRQ